MKETWQFFAYYFAFTNTLHMQRFLMEIIIMSIYIYYHSLEHIVIITNDHFTLNLLHHIYIKFPKLSYNLNLWKKYDSFSLLFGFTNPLNMQRFLMEIIIMSIHMGHSLEHIVNYNKGPFQTKFGKSYPHKIAKT